MSFQTSVSEEKSSSSQVEGFSSFLVRNDIIVYAYVFASDSMPKREGGTIPTNQSSLRSYQLLNVPVYYLIGLGFGTQIVFHGHRD